MSSFTLLLTGVTINSICMAAILFLHYTAGFTQSFEIVRWLMGGIDSLEYTTLGFLSLGIFGSLAAGHGQVERAQRAVGGRGMGGDAGREFDEPDADCLSARFVCHRVGDGFYRPDRVHRIARAPCHAPRRRS